jgi:hypothetical protein
MDTSSLVRRCLKRLVGTSKKLKERGPSLPDTPVTHSSHSSTLVTLPSSVVVHDNQKEEMRVFLWLTLVFVCLGSIGGVAQNTPDSAEELARVSRELQETRAELAESRRQIEELRQGLQEVRNQLQASHPAVAVSSSSAEPSVAIADQDASFLAAKIAELHQDKVESASKYPVKLSGLILFNAYRNVGSLDIQDLPSLAFQRFPGSPDGSIGATLRQTVFGVEATGPKLLGARTSAGATVDFAGGSPTTSFGVVDGLVRLRTAHISLDWESTSLTIGQDTPFFSPLSPTSYATVLEPALAWSGNLWVWTPQVEIEHRFSLGQGSSVVLQGGLLDPLTEESPSFQGRNPTAGEATRVPALAGRIAIDRSLATHYPFTIGFAAYRAQQQYQTFEIDSWTVNSDLKMPLGKRVEVSGEWYEGQAVGGLGGGIWTSVIYPDSNSPHAAIHPLRSTGGWVQLKVKPAARLEINGAFGQDENFGQDLRFFATPYSNYGFVALQKNRTEFVNFVYTPNSFLLFALEYRHLFTAPAVGQSASGDHLNLAAGVRF